jgi:uncharacterized protein YndB with AHSA1/START domain
MSKSTFVYMTYIRTTPEKLWETLTDSQFVRKYWFDATIECGWKKGSLWKLLFSDGRVADMGEILEIEPPRRMVIRWQNEWKPSSRARVRLAAPSSSRLWTAR